MILLPSMKNSEATTEVAQVDFEDSDMSDIIAQLDAENMKTDVPAFSPGDTVVVQGRGKDAHHGSRVTPPGAFRARGLPNPGWVTPHLRGPL